ncbi:hypothetical protein [Variovorax sp. 278MFTsu5.1]|uniref:hypothetical protein n=1 Tax=Variovorax sp. 278MFTsu5.1 TaxID=3158366 RepID=UPI003AAE4680
MTSLVFREGDHTYWLGERRLPSVSEVLAPVQDFEGIPEAVLARKIAIGKAAHLACQFLDEGDEIDPASLDSVVAPYVQGWRLFVAENKPQWTVIEQSMHDEALGYAGTPDRVGFMHGSEWVIDIKTVATVSAATALQTVAYRKLIAPRAQSREPLIKRAAVQLLPTGKYKLHEFKEPTDWAIFQSLLNVKHWSIKNVKR